MYKRWPLSNVFFFTFCNNIEVLEKDQDMPLCCMFFFYTQLRIQCLTNLLYNILHCNKYIHPHNWSLHKYKQITENKYICIHIHNINFTNIKFSKLKQSKIIIKNEQKIDEQWTICYIPGEAKTLELDNEDVANTTTTKNITNVFLIFIILYLSIFL